MSLTVGTPPEARPLEVVPGATERLLRSLREQLQVDGVRLARLVGDQYVHLASAERDGPPPLAVCAFADTFCRQHSLVGAPALTLDAREDPDYGPVRDRLGLEVRSYLTVPLTDPDGQAFGFLCAYDALPGKVSLRDGTALFRAVADLLASSLLQQQQLEAAERAREWAGMGCTDNLTGALDRLGWDRALLLEQTRCARLRVTATVSVVKVLGVREANEAYGQAEGDQLLHKAAGTLRGALGPHDLLARTGGTEFAVLHAGPEPRDAWAVGADLRLALRDQGVAAGVGGVAATVPADLRDAWGRAHSLARAEAPRATPGVRLVTTPVPAPARARAGLVEVSDRADLASLLSSRSSAADATDPRGRLRSLLEAFAGHLGMTMAYVSEIGPTTFTLTETWTQDPTSPVRRGTSGAVEDMYCAHMLAGRIPQAVPDTHDHPLLLDLPATAALPIRSYLGAPVVLSDGRVHGSICAFRETPSLGLGAGEVALIGAMAAATATLLETDLLAVEHDRGLLALVDSLVLSGGPSIVFQPVVSLRDRSVLGYEALSRFPHGGPEEVFASVAEVDDGDRLQRAAVTAALAHLGEVDGFLAVNLSARALLAPTTLAALAEMPVHRIVIEVSEHEVIEDYQAIAAAAAPLRARGLRLAVDDAGSGFASLRHVLALEPEIIKLDVGMVRGLESGTAQAALLKALADFAANSATLLIAEGVETERELAALTEAGVAAGQGYLFARPAPLPPAPAAAPA